MTIGIILRRATQSFLFALVAFALPMMVDAGTINIIIGDQNVVYLGTEAGNTGSIFDTPGGHGGGNETPVTASQVTTATFKLDGDVEGTLLNSNPPLLYGDLRVDGVGNQVPKGTFQANVGNNGGGFGFDFFTTDGHLVELGIDELSGLLIGDGIFFFHGTATVNLLSQILPFNLEFTSPTVSFSYTATSVSVPLGGPGTLINMALGSGAFTITGEGIKVHEPAATILLASGLGIAGLAWNRRRQRST
jgi:hypothetical protein